MTTNQENAIRAHGQQLLAIFPDCTERDPVKLCKKLRRLERQGAAIALRLCNGPEYPDYTCADTACERVLDRVRAILGGPMPLKQQADVTWAADVPIFINRDPRGYALKIDDEYMRANQIDLLTDWGGYGIIAPEFSGKGEY